MACHGLVSLDEKRHLDSCRIFKKEPMLIYSDEEENVPATKYTLSREALQSPLTPRQVMLTMRSCDDTGTKLLLNGLFFRSGMITFAFEKLKSAKKLTYYINRVLPYAPAACYEILDDDTGINIWRALFDAKGNREILFDYMLAWVFPMVRSPDMKNFVTVVLTALFEKGPQDLWLPIVKKLETFVTRARRVVALSICEIYETLKDTQGRLTMDMFASSGICSYIFQNRMDWRTTDTTVPMSLIRNYIFRLVDNSDQELLLGDGSPLISNVFEEMIRSVSNCIEILRVAKPERMESSFFKFLCDKVLKYHQGDALILQLLTKLMFAPGSRFSVNTQTLSMLLNTIDDKFDLDLPDACYRLKAIRCMMHSGAGYDYIEGIITSYAGLTGGSGGSNSARSSSRRAKKIQYSALLNELTCYAGETDCRWTDEQFYDMLKRIRIHASCSRLFCYDYNSKADILTPRSIINLLGPAPSLERLQQVFEISRRYNQSSKTMDDLAIVKSLSGYLTQCQASQFLTVATLFVRHDPASIQNYPCNVVENLARCELVDDCGMFMDQVHECCFLMHLENPDLCLVRIVSTIVHDYTNCYFAKNPVGK